MANTITTNASMTIAANFILGAGSDGATFTNFIFNITGSAYVKNTVTVLTTATLIDLGAVTTPHWAIFQNLDPTNYVQIFNGSSGAVLLRLLGGSPGEFAMCPLDPGCVPYAKANTASLSMAYLICAA